MNDNSVTRDGKEEFKYSVKRYLYFTSSGIVLLGSGLRLKMYISNSRKLLKKLLKEV